MNTRICITWGLVIGFASTLAGQILPPPVIQVTPLEHAVLVVWDSSAASASRFSGYRVQRARVVAGPFITLREWRRNDQGFVPNQFFDVGDDNADGTITLSEQIKNNVEYYYRVSAFGDSSLNPPLPGIEEFSNVISAVPLPAAQGYVNGTMTVTYQSGATGDIGAPGFTITNRGNFDRLFAGHEIAVTVTTISTGNSYLFPVTVTDNSYPGPEQFFMDFSLSPLGDSSAGLRQGPFVKENLFGFGALAISFDWHLEQLRRPIALDSVVISTRTNDSTDTPIVFHDTIPSPFVGLLSRDRTPGEMEYEIEFLAGGTDTVNISSKRIFNYFNVRVTERKTGRLLEAGGTQLSDVPSIGTWTITRYGFDSRTGANIDTRRSADRYYVPTTIDSATSYIFSNSFYIEGTRFVCDYANQGRGIGKPWPRAGRKGTRDFSIGDKLRVVVSGGVRGILPFESKSVFTVGQPTVRAITRSDLEEVRVVPNPYLVRHEAQRSPSERRLFFQYLPTVCTIRIYLLGLELVKTLIHQTGGTEEWDLRNERGNLVASQLFIAHIETPNGTTIVKKFAVVTGE